jgi:hypothetical protein
MSKTKTKKGPLSNKEKSYIEQHYKSDSVDSIAEYLKRSSYMVDKFIKTLSFEVEIEDAEETPEPIKGQSADLFAKNKERGVVVMTEAASMDGDQSKTQRKEAANGIAPRYSKFIHKIKD